MVILEKEEEGVGGEERKTPLILLSLMAGGWGADKPALLSLTILPSETNPRKERTPHVPQDSSIME